MTQKIQNNPEANAATQGNRVSNIQEQSSTGGNERLPNFSSIQRIGDIYKEKDLIYYLSERAEILPLLPEYCEKILDVGCGGGGTVKWLKEIGRCGEATGIELMEEPANIARKYVDNLIVADIENDQLNLQPGYFDCILCLDVLEHLRDPWKILSNLFCFLKPGGVLIVSLPNLRYRTIIFDLLFKARFEYSEMGIMDRTHLRFFTYHSALQLLLSSGLEDIKINYHPSEIRGVLGIFNILSFGIFRDIFSWQILLRGVKPING